VRTRASLSPRIESSQQRATSVHQDAESFKAALHTARSE
jgi:hypothetical protein